jgi:chromosomal replication initiation ATPase DnaA
MRMTARLILALTLDELGIAPREWEARKTARGSTRGITRAGQLAAWLAHRNTSASLQQIGKALGRDHTTVLYALRRVPEMLAADHTIALAAQRLDERIDRLAMLPGNSAEARALLPQSGEGTEPSEART